MKNTVKELKELVVIKRHDGLLVQAKRIFGEKLVVDAWVADRTNCGFVDGRERAERRHADFKDDSSTCLDISMNCVVIEFSNARCVMFSSSEWAHIELVDDEVIEITASIPAA